MHYIVKKMLNKAWDNAFIVDTIQEIGLNTLSLMNSTYLARIQDKFSASYGSMLPQYSM